MRWKTSDEYYPCLVLIDIDVEPRTYEEWTDPIDTYDKVKALATSGLLTSIQIIMVKWPEELRKCQNLKTIQLIYTNTGRIPTWTKEFKNLETIQIESKYGKPNLSNLPGDPFSDFSRLTMIQFGVHENITRFPPLSGVPQLQSFVLTWMLIATLEQIPDLAPLRNLVEMVIYRPNYVCCNGFMGEHTDIISPAKTGPRIIAWYVRISQFTTASLTEYELL
ncbi:hypothetical protein PC112_g16375 [Phytophthora cactorum]|nr:hypothetical protein PC112_g16375 [Phytophthora cactorum]